MKTINHLSANGDKKTKEKSPFWSFMGGEFLLKETVVQWYPFILILFILAIIIIQNESFIAAKYRKIEELDTEYKRIKTQLRFENEFMNHEISPEIIKLVTEQGFIRKDNSTFKIVKPVNSSK
jgi:hypothetical protein